VCDRGGPLGNVLEIWETEANPSSGILNYTPRRVPLMHGTCVRCTARNLRATGSSQ
jgi:hypothetical protein